MQVLLLPIAFSQGGGPQCWQWHCVAFAPKVKVEHIGARRELIRRPWSIHWCRSLKDAIRRLLGS